MGRRKKPFKDLMADIEAQEKRLAKMKEQAIAEHNADTRKSRTHAFCVIGGTLEKRLDVSDWTLVKKDVLTALVADVSAIYDAGLAVEQAYGAKLSSQESASVRDHIGAVFQCGKAVEDQIGQPLEQISEDELERLLTLGRRVESALGVAVSALTPEQIEAVLQHIDTQSSFMCRRAGLPY